MDAGVPLCSEYCLLVEMEEDTLVRGLRFWPHARVPGVRSCVTIVVIAFRHLEVEMLQVVRQNESGAYSKSYLGLAAELS